MDLSPYINQLRDDLTAAASTGDEQARQTAAMLSGAIEPAARLALMSALSDLAAEVTTHLEGPVVEVRLDGRDIRVVVSGANEAAPGPAEEPAPPRAGDPSMGGGGDISRITLRLLDEIKGQAEEAASSQGVSLNTWVAQAVQGALHGRQGGPWANRPGHGPWSPGGRGPWRSDSGSGSRIRGWIQG